MIFRQFGYRGLYWSLKINPDSSCREPELRSDGPKLVKKTGIEKSSIKNILTLVFRPGLWVPMGKSMGQKTVRFMGF
jgi:hypothetical protein